MVSIALQPEYTVLDDALPGLGAFVEGRLWKQEQDLAAQAKLLASGLRALLALYGLHRQLATVWADSVRAGTVQFRADDARIVQRVRVALLRSMRSLDAGAREIETAGTPVQGADELRAALVDCELDNVDVDEALAAIDRLDHGQGVPLAEAMHELRARHRP